MKNLLECVYWLVLEIMLKWINILFIACRYIRAIVP